jgi:Lon protease-like protein
VAQVAESDELPDGRWSLVAVGTERFRVTDWCDDDPYPRAEVELWPDVDTEPVPVGDFRAVESKLHRCLALASEAGVDTGPELPNLEPGDIGTMQLSALLPAGPLDKHRLLGIPGAAERLQAVETLIDDLVELIELNLSTEGP